MRYLFHAVSRFHLTQCGSHLWTRRLSCFVRLVVSLLLLHLHLHLLLWNNSKLLGRLLNGDDLGLGCLLLQLNHLLGLRGLLHLNHLLWLRGLLHLNYLWRWWGGLNANNLGRWRGLLYLNHLGLLLDLRLLLLNEDGLGRGRLLGHDIDRLWGSGYEVDLLGLRGSGHKVDLLRSLLLNDKSSLWLGFGCGGKESNLLLLRLGRQLHKVNLGLWLGRRLNEAHLLLRVARLCLLRLEGHVGRTVIESTPDVVVVGWWRLQ